MKILKFYESLNMPEIGDYAVCEESGENWTPYGILLNDFITTNIGKIVKIRKNASVNQANKYTVQYYNVPDELEDAFRTWGGKKLDNYKIRYFSYNEIKYYNKNDCEVFLTINKYNL